MWNQTKTLVDPPKGENVDHGNSSDSASSSTTSRSKGVAFSAQVRVRKTISRHTMTEKERRAYWFDDEEIDAMESSADVFLGMKKLGIDLDKWDEAVEDGTLFMNRTPAQRHKPWR